MRLSIFSRIMEMEEGVIRRGRRPRRITPSEISIILHMIRKSDSIIVLLFIRNTLFLVKKHSYNMLTSIDVKFIFDSARLGCSALQIFSFEQMSPFELCSCCCCHVFSYYFAQFLLLKRVKRVRHFCFHSQNNSTSFPGLLG